MTKIRSRPTPSFPADLALIALSVLCATSCGERSGVDEAQEVEVRDAQSETASAGQTDPAALAPPPADASSRETSSPEDPATVAPPLALTIHGTPGERAGLLVVDPERHDRAVFDAARKSAPDRWAWSFVERFGTRVELGTPNGEGVVEVTIDQPSRSASLVARTGDRYVVVPVIRARDGRLAIRFDDKVRSAAPTVVVDHGGTRLAGVEVGLASFGQGITFRERSGIWRYELTDRSGEARLRPYARKTVWAHVLGDGLHRAADPGETKIELPPTGSIEVSLPAATSPDSIVELVHAKQVVARRSPIDGRAMFRAVALGREFGVRLDSDTATAARNIVGPSTPDEVVDCALDTLTKTRVAFRVTDASGAPVQTRLEVRWNDSEQLGATGESDAKGNATVTVDPANVAGREVRSIQVLEVGPDAVSNGTRIASAELAPGIDGAVLEGGDLVLRPVAVLVSGLVVDDAGEPIEGAAVRATQTPPESSGTGLGIQNADELMAFRDRDPAPGSVGRATATTDAGGAFVLRADFDAEGAAERAFALETTATGFVQAGSVDFTPGATDVRVPLTRAGSLVVRGPSLAVTSTTAVTFDLVPPDGAEEIHLMLMGETTVRSLRPGPYSLAVTIHDEVYRTIDDIVVRAGETTRDPRLDPIVLGNDVRTDELTVVDGRGAPIALPQMWTETADDWSFQMKAGRKKTMTVISVGERDPRRVISAEGHGFTVLEMLPPDGTVVLPDMVAVEIQLTGADLPNFESAAEIVPADLMGLDYALEREVRIGRTGTVRVTLPGPGTYILRPNPPFGRRDSSPLAPWQEQRFEVSATTKSVAVTAR